MDNDPVLDGVGQRLRALRQQHQLSLAGLSATTGISTSTLSRLTQRPGGPRGYKMIVPPAAAGDDCEQKAHEGYEWMYVLSGRLRLRLAEHDFIMKAGQVAEFDTRVPHWVGSAGPEAAEVLMLFGPQGERMHVRARPKAAG
jgi:quercetin dioxygenase-like cupin family protein